MAVWSSTSSRVLVSDILPEENRDRWRMHVDTNHTHLASTNYAFTSDEESGPEIKQSDELTLQVAAIPLNPLPVAKSHENDANHPQGEAPNSCTVDRGEESRSRPTESTDGRRSRDHERCNVRLNVDDDSQSDAVIKVNATPAVGVSSRHPNQNSRHQDALVVGTELKVDSLTNISDVNRILDTKLRVCNEAKWKRIQTTMFKNSFDTT